MQGAFQSVCILRIEAHRIDALGWQSSFAAVANAQRQRPHLAAVRDQAKTLAFTHPPDPCQRPRHKAAVLRKRSGAIEASGNHALIEAGRLRRGLSGVHIAQSPILPHGIGRGRTHGDEHRHRYPLGERPAWVGQQHLSEQALRILRLFGNTAAKKVIPQVGYVGWDVCFTPNGPCLVEGPISFDLATDRQAAQVKGYHSPVAGDADIFLVPSITAGNLLGKALYGMAGGKMAGLVLGASVPITVNSRGAAPEEKYDSIAIAAAMAR